VNNNPEEKIKDKKGNKEGERGGERKRERERERERVNERRVLETYYKRTSRFRLIIIIFCNCMLFIANVHVSDINFVCHWIINYVY